MSKDSIEQIIAALEAQVEQCLCRGEDCSYCLESKEAIHRYRQEEIIHRVMSGRWQTKAQNPSNCPKS